MHRYHTEIMQAASPLFSAAQFLVGIILLLVSVNAQVDSYLGGDDVSRFSDAARAAIRRTMPEDVYFGTRLLLELQDRSAIEELGVCRTASKFVQKFYQDPVAVGYGLATLQEAQCPIETGSTDENLRAMLRSKIDAVSFDIKYPALLAQSVLKDDSILVSMESALKQLNKHRDDNGLVRNEVELPDGDTERTFLLLELVAATKISSKGIKKTIEKAFALLPGSELRTSPLSDPTLFISVVKAAGAIAVTNTTLSQSQLVAVAEGLLSLRHTNSARLAFKVYTGLKELAQHPNAPLAVVLSRSSLSAPSDRVELEIRSLLGQVVGMENVAATKAINAVSKEEVALPQGRTSFVKNGGTYTASIELPPGVYELFLTVGEYTDIRRSIVLKTTAQMKDIRLTISPTSRASDGQTYVTSGPQSLPEGLRASSLENHHLLFSFTIESSRAPHQAVVRFTHLATQLDRYFAAKRREADPGTWKMTASVSLPEEVEAFVRGSGEYEISLLVGDAAYTQAIEYGLGITHLTFPPNNKKHYPLYKRPLLWDSDNALEALPEIHHQFRRPERRPSKIVSALFTGIILLSFLIFLGSLPLVGANLSAFPKGIGFIWSAAWLICLAAILLLFTAYWVHLKGFTALLYLTPLGTLTVLVGHQALSHSAKPKAI